MKKITVACTQDLEKILRENLKDFSSYHIHKETGLPYTTVLDFMKEERELSIDSLFVLLKWLKIKSIEIEEPNLDNQVSETKASSQNNFKQVVHSGQFISEAIYLSEQAESPVFKEMLSEMADMMIYSRNSLSDFQRIPLDSDVNNLFSEMYNSNESVNFLEVGTRIVCFKLKSPMMLLNLLAHKKIAVFVKGVSDKDKISIHVKTVRNSK